MALDVSGQNVTNANTVGYTRQRADMSAVSTISGSSLFSKGLTVGQGVNVTGVTRMGDLFADARVRTTAASAGYLAQRSASLTQLESTITEPSDNGISHQLSSFWNSWHDVANTPNIAAPGQVLVESGQSLAQGIAAGYRAVSTQWAQTSTQAGTLVTEVNSTADAIAELNGSIRSVLVSGGNANELMDSRDLLVTQLSELTGATVRPNEDGTVNVLIGGNPIVSGKSANHIKLAGANQMIDAATSPPQVMWAREMAGPVALDGGILAGMMNVLAPADATGTGGALAEAAATYNSLATNLADSVNAVHRTGVTTSGAAGGDFFTLGSDPATPPALGLAVTITSTSDIAAGAPGNGALDGSIADKISQLSKADGGPDAQWAAFVVDVGVRTQSAAQSAKVSNVAHETAVGLQLAHTSVDIDEETVNMLAFQRAYQGAARVLTAVDEMLDTLINRTGVVGR